MTVGAASGLNVILKTLLNPGEQVITFAPYFVEYGSYVRNYDGELVVVSPNTVDFQPNLVEFGEKINEKTKAIIINTPNNPTGVIYSEETLQKIAAILEKKQKEFGTSIVLLSDEPYRGAGLRRRGCTVCDKILPQYSGFATRTASPCPFRASVSVIW